MSDADLYQRALKDMARAAHGAGPLAACDGEARGDNPLCGDRVRIGVTRKDGVVVTLGQETRGCLLCQASASLLGLRAPGSTKAAIQVAAQALRGLLKEEGEVPAAWPEFALFLPVRGYASRHGCVLLPMETLLQALS